MPSALTYPGVYIEEIPSGVRTIVSVATSIAAFVDRFRRGAVDEAVHILSFADFEREFGGLDVGSEASYGIQQFFLNGGSEAWVVRVGRSPAAPAPPFQEASAVLSTGGATQVVNVRAGRRIRGASVPNPGTWGNFLRVEIDFDTATLPNAALDPDGILVQGELFNLTVAEVEVRDGRTFVRQTEAHRNLTMRPGVRNNAIEVVNESSRLVQLDRDTLAAIPTPFPPTFRPDATGTLGGALPSPATIPAQGATFDVTVDPDGPSGPTTSVTRTVTLDYGGAAPADYVSLRPFVENAIRAADPNNPLFSGATVQLAGGRYRLLLGRTGAGFNPAATATVVGGATATQLVLAVADGAVVGAQQAALTGGGDSAPLTDAEIRGVRANKTGMYALEDVSLFNILCLPAAANLPATSMRAAYAEAEAYCEERRAFLIIDIPETVDDLDGMQTWLTDNATLRHRNAAVYFPRVLVSDPLSQSRLRAFGPSGTMAGVYAQTDGARGVWKAPAGTDARLRNVQDLVYVLTDRENGALNPLAANCLRSFPIFGNVAWGARTLDGADQQASEWKYVPVRRLALFLEESLFRGTKWVVFEPNDEPLWSQIRLNVGAFMQSLFRQGAFQGQTPREAYLVKCDKETTTQTDINLGIVNIVVGFAPLKPAEFVIIKIQQLAGQIPT
jgi:Bacteriophage tail sheath protein